MIDRTTKLLLAAIGVGVWALVFRPAPSEAARLDFIHDDLASANDRLKSIDMQLMNTNARLKSVDEQLSSIDGSLLDINNRQLTR
jgi:hypothetical protein